MSDSAAPAAEANAGVDDVYTAAPDRVSERKAPERAARRGVPRWMKGVGPLVLLFVLLVVFVRFGPVGVFRASFPPVEALTIQRIALPEAGVMRIAVVNGGPEPVTVSQVAVDDAVWAHTIDGDRTIPRLASRTITVPYPWVEGEPHAVKLITSTGLTFDAVVDVATTTPSMNARYLTAFALLGIYVGVIPVLLGLLWLPFLRGLGRQWVDFFLGITIGLLVFLGVEALVEAVESAALVAGAFQGIGLIVLGGIGTPLAIAGIGEWRRRSRGVATPLFVATLIALGIGLHNLGEGLAVGTSYATGQIATGTLLVVGFLLHNTTEGLGIVAPLASERPRLGRLLLLGLLAGGPTILGAWIGGFSASPVWTTLFFAIGAGAIVQVVIELGRFFRRPGGAPLTTPLNAAGVFLGLLIMYATGLLVAA